MRSLRGPWFAGCIVLCCAASPRLAMAQDSSAAPAARSPQQPGQQSPPGGTPLDPTTAAALERLARSLAEDRAAAAAARAQGDADTAKRLDAEERATSMQFAALASRVDVEEFVSPEQARKIDLRDELEQLIRPALRWMKEATSGPRQVADLTGRIKLLDERLATAQSARRLVERTRDALPPDSAARGEAERELVKRWVPTIEALQDELLVARANLLRRSDDRSLFDRLGGALQEFLNASGMSLLLAAIVFLGVLLGGRAILGRVFGRKKPVRTFMVRVVGVALRLLIVVLAIIAAMLVPYLRNDWLLLAIGLVFLLGAGWVIIRMLPQIFEQLRLTLNVGGVREGERILVDGLPYRVVSLRWYTHLENPDLQGGYLRVPLQFLVGKRSRQSGDGEPWFPSRPGDWVILADGVYGRVLTQTPEVVVVGTFSGPRSYPTADYLRQTPRNLSAGFHVDALCQVGLEHRDEVTTTIRDTLERAIADAVAAVVPAQQVRRVAVLFNSAQPNGFELLAIAECDGAAAAQYWPIRRAMHEAFVRASKEHNWVLPKADVVGARPSS